LERAREVILRLSPDRLCLGGLLDLRGAVPDVVRGVVNAIANALLGGVLVKIVSAGIEALTRRSLRQLLMKWGIIKNETIECLRDIVNTAKEASQYIDDEGFKDVVEEVAKKWGWDVDTFKHFVKTAAGKTITDDEAEKKIEEVSKKIKEELNKVKTEVEGLLVGVKVFFIDDIENGLLYSNFIVKDGVPKIMTLPGTAKNEQNKQSELEPLETDLVDAGRFREVAEDVFSRLVKDGRVVLIGPRGIGKSTLATYVAWRSLLGSLGKVALNEQLRDAVIHVDSLNPGDAAKLNNLIEATGRRFVVIYDPSPVEVYYKPETMQKAKHEIESVENTLRELMEVGNAWVVIILPRELYEQVQRAGEGDVDLRRVLNNLERDVVMVNLRDEWFLREVIGKYSGCDDVSDDLVKGVMGFDSYTLVAKYAGIWLRKRVCNVEDVDEALRESAGEPKLFFANYIWGTILGKSMDLAKEVSIPLILHAAFGPIPEGVTYITKAVNEGGIWRLIDRDRLAKSKLEDLREADLEPIAKWLSTWHEDLIEETLKDLVGLRGEEARNNYRKHVENFIKALDWGYEKALEEVRGLGRETKLEEVEVNLLIFVSERLKHALKPYTNCWKKAALIIGHALAGYDSVPKPEDLPKDLLENVAKSLGDALNRCEIDDYLLVDNEISLLIWYLIKNNYVRDLTEVLIDRYDEAVDEANNVLKNTSNRGSIIVAEGVYGLGLASIIAKAVELGKPIKSGDADVALRLASFAMRFITSTDYVKPILHALEPLRGKAPHRYLELLALASDMEDLDRDTVEYVLDELNTVINNYGNSVKEYAPSMVYAIRAYSNLIGRYLLYFDREEVGSVVRRVVDLLNELCRFSPSLGFIAWAFALAPALIHRDVRELVERGLSVDVVSKTNEILEKLNKMREKEKVKDLMSDKVFMSYVESRSIKTDKETVKISIEAAILDSALFLKHALALYKLNNDEFDEAARLFNEVAEEDREIGIYENYLANRNWVLRAEAIEDSLVGDKLDDLVKKFQRLYEETFNEKHFRLTVIYLSYASLILSNYLVSLALINDVEKIRELLKEHWWVLETNYEVFVLTRLTLNALLNPKDKLDSELKDMLVVEPWELIVAFEDRIENVENACKSVMGSTGKENYKDAVLAAKGDSAAVEQLRGKLIDDFREQILRIERSGWFRGLGFDNNALVSEYKKLVSGLDCASLVELIALIDLRARLSLMLYALINGNERLAKAHALYGAVYATEKLSTRLFLETYRACCDLGKDEFRRAIARLFFLHV